MPCMFEAIHYISLKGKKSFQSGDFSGRYKLMFVTFTSNNS